MEIDRKYKEKGMEIRSDNALIETIRNLMKNSEVVRRSLFFIGY